MRKASLEDKKMVVNILTQSFINDPHVNWLIKKSRNKNKMKIIMEYVFEESLGRGAVYLNDDNTATTLWNTEKQEKVTFRYVKRNLAFLFRIGVISTIRILKADRLIYSKYPEKYCQLYLIGVLPEEHGKGLASAMMNPILAEMQTQAIPIHLETENPRNVEIYKKKGFSIYHTMQIENNTLYWMRR
jgi:ribosomal protein S18 acetylase RimI-like enzyme